MAGLKYERFIVKMSIEQKLRLITSTEFYRSSSVGGYEFPVFDIQRQPYGEDCKGLHVTHFPDDFALASSFNPELVNDVYNAIGEEARTANSFAYFNCTNDMTAEKFTTDRFILGKFLADKVAGLRRGGAYVNFEDVPADEDNADEVEARREIRNAVLGNAQPTSVIISDVEQTDEFKKRFKYGDMTFGVVSSVEEALDFLYSGASFLFLEEDIFDALVNKLTSLTSAYVTAHSKYVSDKMSESSFARLVRTFRVFNGEIIDKACDDIIDIVYSMQDAKENPRTDYKSLHKDEGASFDEINHNELAITAARQSAVLIKNDGVLPVSRGVRLAVMGEYAKDIKYQRQYYSSRSTAEKIAFDEINEYGLNTVGFALGYAKGEAGRSDLIDHAIALCGKADAVLLFLAAEKGADRLPPEQLQLLDTVAGRGAKIIAVVASDGNIDLSFADKCAAVLLTFVSGQGGTVAALDIVTGEVSPSGKLAMPMGRISQAGFTPLYPVGYGLSYTSFEYTNLKANESGVSFTVKNVGGCDGYAVAMLSVKKKNTSSAIFAENQLKGYVKAFVPTGDAVRVKVTFDENTFSQYDEIKGYFVEGGIYTVTVGETPDDEKLTGLLSLKKYEERRDFKNVVEESSADATAVDFSESGLPADVRAARKKLPFGLKLGLALMLALYVDGVLALFAFGSIVTQKDFIFYVIIGVIAVVVNALVIAYICVAAKQRKSQKYLHANVVLTEMLDNVEEFTEIAKVRYKQPVEEEKKEEEPTEEETEAQAEAQELAATYEVKFDDSASEDVVCAEKVSFSELCSNLKEFALTKGVNVELSSVRVLLAAIASCKLVFLTSKNAELLPEFVKVLNEYYGNDAPISADDEWHSPTDLLWSNGEDESKFVLSPFSNAVYAAHKAREQERVLIIDNVNVNNLGSWFCNFLEYANHPTEEYVINFNEETSFKLPNNLTYVLVPQEGALNGLPTEILNAALIAEVMLSRTDHVIEEEVEPKILSHEDSMLLLSEAKEVDFISERVWKKVDALCDTVGGGDRFEIGNKNIIQMESFTSVLIDCGADEPEAVTNMFLSKLAYVLKNTRMYRQDGGDKAVYAAIEKLFTEEELTKIKRVLTKTVQVSGESV